MPYSVLHCKMWQLAITFSLLVSTAGQHIPVGVLLNENDDVLSEALTSYINENKMLRLAQLQVDCMDTYSLTQNMCSLLKDNVFAMCGNIPHFTLNTIATYSRDYNMPFVSTGMAVNHTAANGTLNNYIIYMRPFYGTAIMDFIKYKGWRDIVYLFNGEEALHRMAQLFNAIEHSGYDITTKVIEVEEASEATTVLLNMPKNVERKIVLDLSARDTEAVLEKLAKSHVEGLYLHILLVSLEINTITIDGLRGTGSEYSITGFSLVNHTAPNVKEAAQYFGQDQISLQEALMLDTITLLSKSFESLLTSRDISDYDPYLQGYSNTSIDCSEEDLGYTTWEHGEDIINFIKMTHFEGLTGMVAFNSDGFRERYEMEMLEYNHQHELEKIGVWSENGIKEQFHMKVTADEVIPDELLVTSILTEPFLMLKSETHGQLSGNDRFEGFCVDLVNLLAKYIGTDLKIVLVKDNHYGYYNKSGIWNGMIGELIRREVDMAIAPLTITVTRETVVDFSKPFLHSGIAGIKKRRIYDSHFHAFSFLIPFSMDMWLSLLAAFIGVSCVLFITTALLPSEKIVYHTVSGGFLQTRRFSIINSLWFTAGGMTNHKSNFYPRSLSGRILASTLWCFSIVIICMYLAILMSTDIRTEQVEQSNLGIRTIQDLARQTNVKYGCIKSGSTCLYFQTSTVSVYERMWDFMASEPVSVFVKSNSEGLERVKQGGYTFLGESTTIEYMVNQHCDLEKIYGTETATRGYGVAFPIGSPYRSRVDIIISQLMETGELHKLYVKWWYDKSLCASNNMNSAEARNYAGRLDLRNIGGLFYTVLIGLLFALLVLPLEVLVKSRQDAVSRKISFKQALKFNLTLAIKGHPKDDDQMQIILDESHPKQEEEEDYSKQGIDAPGVNTGVNAADDASV